MTTWLVCEHGPIGSAPLLEIGASAKLAPAVLVTTSLSSHLYASALGVASTWLHCWDRPPDLSVTADWAHFAQSELARTRRYPGNESQIGDAVSVITAGLEALWAREPPTLVVIWERRRALGSLVAARALAAGVPVVMVQNGFRSKTVLVDRLVSEEHLWLATRELVPADGDIAPSWDWRRPSGIDATPLSRRAAATIGLWVDYVEKLARAVSRRPALIPGPYWRGFLEAWLAGPAPEAGDVIPKDLDGAVVLALHTPPSIGRHADPWGLADWCLDQVASSRPLLICPHPGDRNVGLPPDLRRRIRARPATYVVRGTPTWTLLDRAALVVTLTSSIGLESVSRGIPTIAIDSACYARSGLAHPLGPNPAQTLATVSADPRAVAPDASTVAAFLLCLEREHLVDGDVQAMTPQIAEAVASKVATLAALRC